MMRFRARREAALELAASRAIDVELAAYASKKQRRRARLASSAIFMVGVLLAILLALTAMPARAQYSACVNGRDCKARTYTATTRSNGTIAVQVPNLDFVYLGASCALRSNGSNLSLTGCNWSWSGGTQVLLSGGLYLTNFALPASFTAPSANPNAVTVVSETTMARAYMADGNTWTEIGGGRHPVLNARLYQIDMSSAGAFAWHVAPRIGGTAMSVTETCNAVVDNAQLSNAVGESGTFTRTGRSCATSAVSSNVASVSGGANSSSGFGAGSNNRFRMCGRAQLDALTSVRFLWGQMPTAVLAAPTDTPTAMGAWFRFSSAAGDTNWMICTSDSASPATCTSTGVAAVAGTAALLCIDKRESGAVTAWVNGAAPTRQTSNIPASGAGATVGFTTMTLSAAVRTATSSNISLELY